MRIMQIIYSLSSGGAEKFVVDLSNELAERGHDVVLCILRDDSGNFIFNKQFLNSNVRFYSMKLDKGFSISKYQKVKKYIMTEMPDVVHCHLNVIPYIYEIALFNKEILFIHTLHNVASNTGGVGVQYYLNRFFYKHNIIHPICISKLCQKSFKSYYNLNNAPYINNGRAVVDVSPKYRAVSNEVDSYKISKTTPVFIHVARFSPQKNQQLLVDSFNKLDSEMIDFTLLIIGNGYDCEEGKRLQFTACNKIHFLGEKDNVIDYLKCSDAFCLTSLYEGLPISLLEALSCGVTPICTPVGGISDVIVDSVYGYLSVGHNVDEYCKAIRRFMKHPLPSQRLIGYFNENYSMEICAKKYEDIYNLNRI